VIDVSALKGTDDIIGNKKYVGRCKEYQIEMEQVWSRGYIVPEHGIKKICVKHFSHSYLARYVQENGYAGICSYCGVHTMVIDFIDYVGNRLVDYLGPMDNEGLFLDSSFMDDDGIPGFIKRISTK